MNDLPSIINTIIYSYLEYDDATSLLYVSKYNSKLVKDYFEHFHASKWITDIAPRIFDGKLSKEIYNIYSTWNTIYNMFKGYLNITDDGNIIYNDLNIFNANKIPLEIYMLEWLVVNYIEDIDRVSIGWEGMLFDEYRLYRLHTKNNGTWVFRDMDYIDVIVDQSVNCFSICKFQANRTTDIHLMYDISSERYYFAFQLNDRYIREAAYSSLDYCLFKITNLEKTFDFYQVFKLIFDDTWTIHDMRENLTVEPFREPLLNTYTISSFVNRWRIEA